jgi:outer membrane protein assembly factor BamB
VFSQPTVSGNLLFIGSCAGKFLALDKATGKEVWSYDTKIDGGPFSFHGDPLIHEDLVLIPADHGCGVAGYVYAFERKSGKVRWKLGPGAAATSLVNAGNAVIFGTRQDAWVSVAIDSGKLKWEFKDAAPDPQCGIPKPPATDGTTLAFVTHDQSLHVLDVKSGRELRKVKLSSPASTGLFMYKGVLYFGTEDGRLRSLDPESGQSLGEHNPLAVLSGRFAWKRNGPEEYWEYGLGSNTIEKRKKGVVLAFTDEFDDVVWSQSSEMEWASEQPHLWKEWVIVGNCRGEMVAYRATDGAVAWTEHIQGCIRSFGHDASTLYVGVQQGTVYACRR